MGRWLSFLTILILLVSLNQLGVAAGNDVVFENKTDLPIVRLIIGERTLEGLPNDRNNEKIFVQVTPRVHHLRIVFRGGADADWPKFNFHGIHEVIFTRNLNRIDVHTK